MGPHNSGPRCYLDENTLDNLCHNHICRWLEIPLCGTIDIDLLSTTQYGNNLPVF